MTSIIVACIIGGGLSLRPSVDQESEPLAMRVQLRIYEAQQTNRAIVLHMSIQL